MSCQQKVRYNPTMCSTAAAFLLPSADLADVFSPSPASAIRPLNIQMKNTPQRFWQSQPSMAAKQVSNPLKTGNTRYGLWWREQNWSNYASEDSFFARGHGGQFLFLFPSIDLMVVVTPKWNVDKKASRANVRKVFSFVDKQILTSLVN